ncbi:hypothetical protein GF339_19680 [candidate division KSB3 bacterium]|uniref:Uncharacterized protein n=1 Tax=candidate division KSB3 bacterium TaxID=2044937 RepID=A0A9D5JZ35_9BACT|nr:hypothetical protein [candidate division KSB3 bacterium]MBD3326815.1 hypothetical protein [candidate division KSB3 bacterium]
MEYLVRKVSRAKWAVPSFGVNDSEIAADAVKGCLRTSGNTLSFWQCNSEPEDVNEAVLALASSMERLDTFDVIVIPKNDLNDFSFEATLGNTPISDLRERHLDMIELTMGKLTEVARYVANSIRNENKCQRFRKKQLEGLVMKAVRDGRLRIEDLSDRQQRLREEILKRLKDQHSVN